jgi:hypothetical protein
MWAAVAFNAIFVQREWLRGDVARMPVLISESIGNVIQIFRYFFVSGQCT